MVVVAASKVSAPVPLLTEVLLPVLAVAATLVVVLKTAERDGLSGVVVLQVGLFGFAGALLGGAALALPAGGFSSIGAFAGAFAAGGCYLRARGEPVLAYADSAVAGVALGYAILRLVCLLEGHCDGIATTVPWAIASDAGPVHPTQLYHAALGVAAFMILARMREARFATALLMYGAGRFVIELFRADAVPVLGPFDVTHLLCIAMVAVGLTRPWKRALRPGSHQPASQGG